MQALAAAQPQIVPISPSAVAEDVIQIRFRGAAAAWNGRSQYSGRGFAFHSNSMIDLSHVRRYYVACGYTDLRRGIDGLAAIATQQFGAQLKEEDKAATSESRMWLYASGEISRKAYGISGGTVGSD